MEATLDIEFLRGLGPDPIIKELALVSDGVIQTIHFKPPLSHECTRFKRKHSKLE